LGYYNDFMLNTEPDLKEYIDRNGVIEWFTKKFIG
jgi:hypothetical protein